MADPERRELEFSSLEEAVADIEQLAAGETRTVGNHSFAEIVRHLANTNDATSGRKSPPKPPFFMRLIMPFMKSSILNGPVKPGFKLPAKAESYFWPSSDVTIEDAITQFKESVEYFNSHGPLEVHPFFGKVDRGQMKQMNLLHAAMHLSFVHPAS